MSTWQELARRGIIPDAIAQAMQRLKAPPRRVIPIAPAPPDPPKR